MTSDEKKRCEKEGRSAVFRLAELGNVVAGVLMLMLLPAAVLGVVTVFAAAGLGEEIEGIVAALVVGGNVIMVLILIGFCLSFRESANLLLRCRALFFMNLLAYIVGVGCTVPMMLI